MQLDNGVVFYGTSLVAGGWTEVPAPALATVLAVGTDAGNQSIGNANNIQANGVISAGGAVNTNTAFTFSGTQVVTTQQAAVAPPAGGGTIDTECRNAVSDLILRLIAHGLIAP